MRRIIVATDYSAEALNATEYVAKAAAEHKFELVLFSLYNISIHALNARLSGEAINEIINAKHDELAKAAAKLSETFGITVEPHFSSGDFHEEISRCISMHNADLVVLGMAQKSFEQDLLGNTTTAAIHKLTTPVMAIPLGVTYTGIKRILFACDIVRGVHKRVLEEVRDMATEFGAEVEVFYVRKKIDELLQDQTNVVDEVMTGTRFYYQNVEASDVIYAIQDEALRINADILIMVPYKYGF